METTETNKQSEKPQQSDAMITIRTINERKLHVCEKCGLEFTSGNSVLRHQEKSCLRVRVINLKSSSSSAKGQLKDAKKKCPICSSIFFNTHRLSIHIYKHHRNLLGSAKQAPSSEARRLNELQLRKVKASTGLRKEMEPQLESSEATVRATTSGDTGRSLKRLKSSESCASSSSSKVANSKETEPTLSHSNLELSMNTSINAHTDYLLESADLSMCRNVVTVDSKLNLTF